MMISPLQYTDYRSYLREYYTIKKRTQSNWSYAVWAKLVGVQSPSTLAMIVKGQRDPSEQLAKQLAQQLKLSDHEQSYFCDLVSLSKHKDDPAVSVLLLEKLASSKETKGFWVLDHENFLAISHWYFYAIRQMVGLADFKEDSIEIASRLRFKVNPKQIEEAIAIMIERGLLTRDSKGLLCRGPEQLNTSQDLASEALKRYHEETLENARQAIRSVDPLEREISGVCFSIKKDSLMQAKQLIRKFQMDLSNVLGTSDGDSVYQLEVSFFPLTQEKEII